MGQTWPLLVLNQSVHQKEPRTLTAAGPSQLSDTLQEAMWVLPALWYGSTARQGQWRVGGLIGSEGER